MVCIKGGYSGVGEGHLVRRSRIFPDSCGTRLVFMVAYLFTKASEALSNLP